MPFREQGPHVDVLMNNAGIVGAAPLTELTDEDWGEISSPT